MNPIGYTYSDGSVICPLHALMRGLEDENSESGEAGAIFRMDEAFYDVACDVAGCGIILEKNAYEA